MFDAVSDSMVFLSDFEIPAARLEALAAARAPSLTPLDSIRDEAALTDWIYDGAQFHYRSLFDVDDLQERLDWIEDLLATVVAHGGEGTAVCLRFEGSDEGELIRIERGVVTRAPFSSAKEAAAIRASKGYLALRERVAEAFKPAAPVVKSKGAAKPKASKASAKSAAVSPLRLSELGAKGSITAASAGKLAPFLDVRHEDRKEACLLLASLFYNSGGGRYTLKMSEQTLAPLIALAPDEPAARQALAAAAASLWSAQAYPEARASIEALIPFESEAPWAPRQFRLPWDDQQPSSLTGPRQLAMMHLYRAECLLAMGEAALGEEAFKHALERAEAASVPTPLQLSPSTQDWGTHDDFRVYALTRAARALRFLLLGKDACLYRAIPKSKQGSRLDPTMLATATRYAEDALAVVAARAPAQYAGLTPLPLDGHDFAPEQQGYEWQWEVYLEAALLDEMKGNAPRARHRVGQAKFLAALENPTHENQAGNINDLLSCVARLGALNTPLDAPFAP